MTNITRVIFHNVIPEAFLCEDSFPTFGAFCRHTIAEAFIATLENCSIILCWSDHFEETRIKHKHKEHKHQKQAQKKTKSLKKFDTQR